MEILIVVVAIVVLTAGAVAGAGAFGGMPAEPVRDTYAAALPEERPVSGTDLDGVRFGVSARGYDMDQVDALMARMTQQLGPGAEPSAAATASPDEPADRPMRRTDGGRPQDAEHQGRPQDAEHQGRPQDAVAKARDWRGREADRDAEARQWRPRD